MKCAAANGHLQIVKYLYEHRREDCKQSAIKSAVKNRRADILQFFEEIDINDGRR
jgi:hypothetical protein